MASILEEYLSGKLSCERFQQHLTSSTNLKHCDSDKVGSDIVTFFLNFIREDSSHHFTANLPVISPKKIKKKKRVPRTPNTSNDSSRNSARGSLFNTPPSGGHGTLNLVTQPKDISPISPALKHGESTPENAHTPQVTSTPVKFNLDDDFPPVSTQKEPKRKNATTPTRRITPTPARASYPRRGSSTVFKNLTFETSQESDSSFGSDPSISSDKSFKQRQKVGKQNSASPRPSRRANTSKLKLEDFMQKDSCAKRRNSAGQQYSINSTFDKSHSVLENPHRSICLNESKGAYEDRNMNMPSVTPKKDHVTKERVLQSLARAHSFCITENLVPNIVVELCFVLQLLTLQEPETKDTGTHSRYLTTIHNCVYYAVLVLEKLTKIFELLDKGTLRLLLDNPRIGEFSSELQSHLAEAYPKIPFNKVCYSLTKSPLNSVPFQASVDNRQNFSNDQSFHSFKKQRDTFYEVVREWEDSHTKPGWCLEEKLGQKIRSVVHQKQGLSNHSHFARLFQSQLIQMCCYEKALPTFNEGESPEIVGNLLKSNPEKLFRLQQRLVAPLSATSGPCPPPGFTETEEFFREFIVCAMCPLFNKFLTDSFIAKIIELNSCLDVSENAPSGDTDEENAKFQVKFATFVITLRTLAKFLGFLVFSPYHSSTEIPTAVKENILTSRNQVSEPLDIMEYLEQAQNEGKLVLTLPWVIEYLSMIDNVGPYLNYYKRVFEWLHRIYKLNSLGHSSVCANRADLMLAVALGWLFEIPSIPEVASHKQIMNATQSGTRNFVTLDKMDLVDQQLLYTCCPYLGELRSILAEAVAGRSLKRGSVKKIKPICADKTEVSSFPNRRLQTQLEDNFFRNQPEFLKKTVDFVTSRIYYNSIAFVRNNLIPKTIEEGKRSLNVDTVFSQGPTQELTKDEMKERNKGLLSRLNNLVTDELLQKILNQVDKECKNRSLESLTNLSPYDMDSVVIKTAAGIVHQSTMDKLLDWSHQSLPGIVEKEVERHIDKILSAHYNNSLHNHIKYAEDPDNNLNWFYQKLVDKANQRQPGNEEQDINMNLKQNKTEGKHNIEQESCLEKSKTVSVVVRELNG